MPTPQDITAARETAQGLANTYQGALAGTSSVTQQIKQKVQEAFNYNKDIVEPLNQATTQYLAAPATARERYQDIFNPFTREKLVSQYTANEALPMLNYSSLLGQRMGSTSDIVSSGVGAYQADVGAKQAAAENARQLYGDLMNEYQLYKPAAGGSGGSDLSSALSAIFGAFGAGGMGGFGLDTGVNTLSEDKPAFIPKKQNVDYHSPQGQWVWNRDFMDWVPADSEVVE